MDSNSESFRQTVQLLIPKPFGGEKDEEISTWLFQFECYCRALKYTNDQKILLLPLLLKQKSSAMKWYMLEHVDDYETMKTKLIARFGPHSSEKWKRLKEFNERRKRPTESLHSFRDEIQTMGKVLGKSDESITEAFIQGLDNQIANHVKLENVSSLDEAFQQALLKTAAQDFQTDTTIESLKTIDHQISNLSKAITIQENSAAHAEINQVYAFDTVTGKLATRKKCKSCGKNHERRFCKQGNVWCEFCQIRGHNWVACKKKDNVNSKNSPKILCANAKVMDSNQTKKWAASSNNPKYKENKNTVNSHDTSDTQATEYYNSRCEMSTFTDTFGPSQNEPAILYADFDFSHLNNF